jgi:S-adenosyl methyltransferase
MPAGRDDAGGPPQVMPSPLFDTSVPHIARVYNYWLGGKDHFAADRELAERFIKADPEVIAGVRANRAFLGRAVHFLAARARVRQFLDIGTGIPTANNTHEVAQRAAPDSRVVYVDNDPIVLAHARALLTSTPEGVTDYVDADMRDPAAVLARAEATLDFGQPIGLMIMGVMGHIPDDDEAQSIVQRLLAGLPSGSYLAMYDGLDTVSEAMTEAQEGYDDTGAMPYKLRYVDQVRRFFDGLEFVEPGLVRCPEWRPDPSQVDAGANAITLAGVARKP